MATPTSRPPVRHHHWRLTLTVIAGLAVTLGVVLPSPAGADAVGDAQAQAAQISAQLNQLNGKLEALDEQFNSAKINLKNADDRIHAAQGQLAQTQNQLAEYTSQLRGFAVQAYMEGDDTPALEAVLTSQGDTATERKGYLEAAAGNRQDLIDKLSATRHQADSQLAQLNAAHASAAKIADQLSAASSQERAAVAKESQLNDQATGRVRQLVDQQAAAQAQARVAAATQAQKQAVVSNAVAGNTRSSHPIGGGGSAGQVVPPPGVGAGAAVAAAVSQIGVPYVWAGATPGRGFDCSGLTMWAWGRAGVGLPHSAQGQYNMSTHISEAQLQPGDLVFYGSSPGSISHVGLYVGGGTMVHAPHTGATVTYQSIHYWAGEGMYFGRV
jgi:peptidoglycan DL-endopeptidase CwlO